MNDRLCKLCPLSTSAQVAGYGPKDAKLIVIGEFPNNDDEQSGIPFSRSKNAKREGSTAIVRNAIKSGIGLDPETEVYWAMALRCNPFHRSDKIKATVNHVNICRNHLERDLADVPTPVVLLLGKWAVASVTGNTSGVGANRVWPKHVTFAGHRRHCIVSYSPAEVYRRMLWKLDENLNRVGQFTPRGSIPAFFKEDLREVRRELEARGLVQPR